MSSITNHLWKLDLRGDNTQKHELRYLLTNLQFKVSKETMPRNS